MTLTVTSSSFRNGDVIPAMYAVGVPAAQGHVAANGGDRNPDVRWSGEPAGTRSFAVLAVDPDVPADPSTPNREDVTVPDSAPRQDFSHGLVVDIPSSVHEIAEGADSNDFVPGGKPIGSTPYGGIRGANNYTQYFAQDQQLAGAYGGYDGPFPPFNDERVHHYHFQVFALDVPTLGLSGAFGLEDVRQAMQGHVLDQGELIGLYSLNPNVEMPRA
jgi:Raf kinase inhibitor-like YbhB/YbcL family protein